MVLCLLLLAPLQAIAQASSAGGSSQSGTAKALASALAQGDNIADAVSWATAQAYGYVSLKLPALPWNKAVQEGNGSSF